jgi:hypothetical protein
MLPQSRNAVNTHDGSNFQKVRIEDGRLVLETGNPVTATLKYGTPLTGKNRWGNNY